MTFTFVIAFYAFAAAGGLIRAKFFLPLGGFRPITLGGGGELSKNFKIDTPPFAGGMKFATQISPLLNYKLCLLLQLTVTIL